MTHELECRRLDGEAPFDGLTLYSTENVTADKLSTALSCIVAILQKHFGSVPLRFFDCWLEHDGILCVTEPSSWKVLHEEVAHEHSLKHAFSWWDDEVRRAYLPTSQIFLLRYYYNHGNSLSKSAWSGFDLTGQHDLISEVANEIQKINIDQIKMESPIYYFNERSHIGIDLDYYEKYLQSYRRGESKCPIDYPPEMWRTSIR